MTYGARNRNYLFNQGGHLSDFFRRVELSVKERVDAVQSDYFAVNSDDHIVDHIVSGLYLEPLRVYVENQTMTAPSEKKVDVSNDRGRYFSSERSGPVFIDGVEVSLHIPYTGNRALWDYQPSRSYMGNAPNAQIITDRNNGMQGELVLSHSLPSDIGPERIREGIKSYFDSERKMIVEYVSWSTNDVEQFNKRLPDIVRQHVQTRRKYLEQNNRLLALLDIPVRVDPKAPPIVPVQLRPHIKVELTPPPKTGIKPEYGIRSELYEGILEIIRHEARSFETTPETFNRLEEEQLRDVLLSHLNGHFKGAATAEAFRKKGKTDIRIEEQGRSAFVAECKVWGGQAQMKAALEQLLDYLVWRDCKASLIIFNKNVSSFSELFEKTATTLTGHELFVRRAGEYSPGEWRYVFRSKEDPGREITVHVFLVNVFYEKRPKTAKTKAAESA